MYFSIISPRKFDASPCDRKSRRTAVPEASRVRAPDSPMAGEERSPSRPGRRRILLAKVEDESLEEAVLKAWLRPAISKPEDLALLGLDA
jgi:hypothetical protein